jgi:predicted ester cyclase
MTHDELAAFYRRYNACCNEHRFDGFGEFVADDVVINGTDRELDAYASFTGLRQAPPRDRVGRPG